MIHHTTSPRTAIEKIVASHAIDWDRPRQPKAGDFVMLRPRHVMTHDNTSAVIPKFRAIAGHDASVHDPDQPVFAIDHDIQNHTPENLGKYARIRAFAEAQGIRHFPPGRGIAHQVMVEEGLVQPCTLIVASDSHANMYGAMNAVGTPVVRTDAAAIWATGAMWWTIPPQVRVILRGQLPPGVTGKDVILTLCATFDSGEVLNTAVEFAGEGVASLTIDDRLTIANMTTEWGAIVGLFPFDEVLYAWLRARADRLGQACEQIDELWQIRHHFSSDAEAFFVRELELDLASVRPHVSGPNSLTVSVSPEQLTTEPIRIDKAYLMSCVNGRLADIKAAARVFAGGRRVADSVEFYIAAASSRVEQDARESGDWQTLLDAGAIPLPAGCGACIGLGRGTLAAGEVGISATNRNFDARMGHRDSRCYLASPAVVAESAIRGYIALPNCVAAAPLTTRRDFTSTEAEPADIEPILDGFPATITGRTLIIPRDQLNTDQIYGKDVTYRDDLSSTEQAAHAMRNHDSEFASMVRHGDILVAGANFGCGSSREQAATALIGAGITAIIAASVSQTYQRNAFNNGLIVIECPRLARDLISHARDTQPDALTVSAPEITIDFAASTIQAIDRMYTFAPLNTIAQRLLSLGGLEALVRDQLAMTQGAHS